MELAGLRIDEVGGELAGITSEQDVRERDVAPVETLQVQSGEEDDHGVDEALDGFTPNAAVEERTVGEGERQVAGQEDRVQRVLRGSTVKHDSEGLDAGDAEARQLGQHAVFPHGHFAEDLFGRDDVLADLDESDDVAGDAAWQGNEMLRRPLFERRVPWQSEEVGVGFGS